MRLVCLILMFFIFNLNILAFCEEFFENPIEFKNTEECKLNEFCMKYIDDIDIEKFIKQEMKNDYVIVSLDECIDIALKNNFDMKIGEHEYKSSKYQYENAMSKFLPFLNTNAYIADYSGQILVGGVLRDTFHETAVSANITAGHQLTEGGKQIFEAKAKKYFSRAQKHDWNYTRSEALYYTTRYYYEMLLAKIYIEIYLRNLIERNAQLTLTEKQQKSGVGTRFDVVRSKNESAQAKISLLSALNDFRIAQTRLANIMGINVETALMPFEDDVKPLFLMDEKLKLEDLYKLALENREDLAGIKDLISYEKQIKRVYITEYIPKPYFEYQQQYQGTLGHSVRPNYIFAGLIDWQPGENLGVGTWTKIKMQKENINVKKLEFENKLRQIEQALTEAYSTSLFNKKEMSITKQRMDYSKEGIKLAMLRFKHGKGILLDVIQAQGQMTTARVEYVGAIIKYNISQTQLLFNTGLISKEILVKNYNP